MSDRTTSNVERPAAGTAIVSATPVTIRPASEQDAPALVRLAALDSSTVPVGNLLIAEVDGELRAAVAVGSRKSIADPFHATAGHVALLRARATQLVECERSIAHGRRRGLARRLRLAD